MSVRYGQSLLLSETLEAAHLEYQDCAALQIVCPACREPVFKAVREIPAVTHYLAHYGAAGAYAADCEMRVGRFDPRAIELQNIISRGQKLQIFLRVLREAIEREYTGNVSNVSSLFRMLNRSKPIAFLYRAFSTYANEITEAMFQAQVEFFIKNGLTPAWRTGFAIATQRRIAWDIWRTLQTPPEEPNRRFCWLHGYALLLNTLQKSLDHGVIDEPSKVLRNYAESLVRIGRDRGMALIKEMQGIAAPQPFSEPGSSYTGKLASEVTYWMMVGLVQLDYFDILRAQKRPAPL